MRFSLVKILFTGVALLLVGGSIFAVRDWQKKNHGGKESADALVSVGGQPRSFEELAGYFKGIAETKGAAYAFEVLKKAIFPPDIDLHLLGHVVGDELFKQQGLEGIKVCTDDFRNACSHAIVVGLFLDKGEGALPQIAEACRQAPGGSGAYTMCIHGLGHGIVAALGYEVPKAVGVCKKLGTTEHGGQEVGQCIGGITMEMISGGGHNRELWAKERPRYLVAENPLSLCASDFMPAEGRYLCHLYLTPFLWEAVGGNAGFPMPEDFRKAFQICDQLPPSDASNRDACFGGFGKEFIGLVQGRDIRKEALAKITDAQLGQIYAWCRLAPHKEGAAACAVQALQSLYWGGENDRSIAIRFCGIIDEEYFGRSCFLNLIGAVASYIRDADYQRTFCEELPSQYQKECSVMLQ
ncbi:MAG: hypothetical protein Q8R13_00770 [bacterium]|nr:hypothetical protein [bacterium]MDZ4296129.1 hypothetical protein [Patescibacteria group bacterium]